MMPGNIHYRSGEIERYYRTHRTKWDHFYLSEREVFARLGLGKSTAVLDIGCGCGGLGLALRERFGIDNYTGIEVNSLAVASAAEMNPRARFFDADVLALSSAELADGAFDLVVSLSCIDWNVEFGRMLDRAWQCVRPGGYFLSSFRIVTGEGVSDMRRSFQYINFEGKQEGETAPYVVLNSRDLFSRLAEFCPVGIRGYGYWGPPSTTAKTPFARVCFVVVALEKSDATSRPMYQELDLPTDILETLEF